MDALAKQWTTMAKVHHIVESTVQLPDVEDMLGQIAVGIALKISEDGLLQEHSTEWVAKKTHDAIRQHISGFVSREVNLQLGLPEDYRG